MSRSPDHPVGSTTRLYQSAIGGKRTSVGRLIERFDPFLRKQVRRHLGPTRFARDGEDVLQVLRMALVEGLPSVRGTDRKALVGWVKTVVRNRLVDWERRQRARGLLVPGRARRVATDEYDQIPGKDRSPSEFAIVGEERRRIWRAIDRVPRRYRSVLRLIFESQPTPEEVARYLGKSADASRKFVARALLQLRKACEEPRS